jgi:hypothetical protein
MGIELGWGEEGIAPAVASALKATASAVSAQASELVGNISEEVIAAADKQKGRGADGIKGVARAIGGLSCRCGFRGSVAKVHGRRCGFW